MSQFLIGLSIGIPLGACSFAIAVALWSSRPSGLDLPRPKRATGRRS